MAKNTPTSPLGPWTEGIDNVHAETNIGPNALREATNINLADGGEASSRAGYARVSSGTDVHSLWREGLFPYALYVDGDTLYATTMAGAAIALRPGLARREMSNRLIGDRVYWGNGAQSGVVTAQLDVFDLGVETPQGWPAMSAVDGGLLPGKRQVTLTYRNFLGEDSGAREGAEFYLPDGKSLQLDNLPQPLSQSAISTRIWMTPPDGDVFYPVRDVPRGMTSVLIDREPSGRPLETLLMEQMPPGAFVDALAGRLYVYDELHGHIVWSEGVRYGLTIRAKNYVGLRAERMMKAIGDGTDGPGLYVSDEKRVYWLALVENSPVKLKPRPVYMSPVVRGTAVRVDGSKFGLASPEPVLYWLCQNGVACIGLPGGQVQVLREEQARAPAAARGSSLFSEKDGVARIITTLRNGQPQQTLALRDRAIARIVTD